MKRGRGRQWKAVKKYAIFEEHLLGASHGLCMNMEFAHKIDTEKLTFYLIQAHLIAKRICCLQCATKTETPKPNKTDKKEFTLCGTPAKKVVIIFPYFDVSLLFCCYSSIVYDCNSLFSAIFHLFFSSSVLILERRWIPRCNHAIDLDRAHPPSCLLLPGYLFAI